MVRNHAVYNGRTNTINHDFIDPQDSVGYLRKLSGANVSPYLRKESQFARMKSPGQGQQVSDGDGGQSQTRGFKKMSTLSAQRANQLPDLGLKKSLTKAKDNSVYRQALLHAANNNPNSRVMIQQHSSGDTDSNANLEHRYDESVVDEDMDEISVAEKMAMLPMMRLKRKPRTGRKK